MTKREIAELITVMQANYPDSFKGQSDAVVSAKIGLWYDFFKDYPKEVVYSAVKAYMATDTKSFMPNVGQIGEQIRKLKEPHEMTEMEAWGYVTKALRNSGYGSVEEFDKLPAAIQRVVGRPEQLKEWACMDEEVVQSVISSNFQRSFAVRIKNDQEYEKLPDDVKRFIGKMTSGALGRLEVDVHEEIPKPLPYM